MASSQIQEPRTPVTSPSMATTLHSTNGDATPAGQLHVHVDPPRSHGFKIPQPGDDPVKLALLKKKRGVYPCINAEKFLMGDEPSVAIEIFGSGIIHLIPDSTDVELCQQFIDCSALEKVSDTAFRVAFGAEVPIGTTSFSVFLPSEDQTQKATVNRGVAASPKAAESQAVAASQKVAVSQAIAATPDSETSKRNQKRFRETLLRDTLGSHGSSDDSRPSSTSERNHGAQQSVRTAASQSSLPDNRPPSTEERHRGAQRAARSNSASPGWAPPRPSEAAKVADLRNESRANLGRSSADVEPAMFVSPPNVEHEHSNQEEPERSVEGDAKVLVKAIEQAGESTQEPPKSSAPKDSENTGRDTDASEVSTDIEESRDARHEKSRTRTSSEESTINVDSDMEHLKRTLKPVEVSPVRKKRTPEPVEVSPVRKKRKFVKEHRESPRTRASTRGPPATTEAMIRVYFASSTTIDLEQGTRLRGLGVVKTEDIATCDAFCVKNRAPLVRSMHFVTAVTMGKPVVSDEWLWASLRVSKRHSHTDYLVKDGVRERAWRFSLKEAVERGRQGVQTFEGCRVVFTDGLRQSLGNAFNGLTEVALRLGATAVDVVGEGRPSTATERNLLLLGDENDAYTQELIANGWTCYGKNMLVLGALRGQLDLASNEFRLGAKALNRSSREKRKTK